MADTLTKTDLGSMTRAELDDYIRIIGESRFRAAQIAEWLRRGVDFDGMSNLPAPLRARLAETCTSGIPGIERKLVSKVDGTVKYLFRLDDGECVETVIMFYKHGTTACISSQVGCRMGCRFCASTIGGKVRDLRPSEMLGQLTAAAHDLGERIDGVVMMGIGEPLDNYENTVKFLHLVTSADGLNIGGTAHLGVHLRHRPEDLRAGKGRPRNHALDLAPCGKRHAPFGADAGQPQVEHRRAAHRRQALF